VASAKKRANKLALPKHRANVRAAMCIGLIAAVINKKKPKTAQRKDARTASAKKATLAETVLASRARKIVRLAPKIAAVKAMRSATMVFVRS